jgi:hypothetical protein
LGSGQSGCQIAEDLFLVGRGAVDWLDRMG